MTLSVRLIGVEAGGAGTRLGEHAARFSGGSPGVLHGALSYLLQDEDGQVGLTHSVSAGLDYALIGPEHAWLHDQNRAEYAVGERCRGARCGAHAGADEGIIPALESSHAIAEAIRRAPAEPDEMYRNQYLRPGRQRHRYLPRKHARTGSLMAGPERAPGSGICSKLQSGRETAKLHRLSDGRRSRRPRATAALVLALERGGADLIELGVPFSDPIADGPVIQRASRSRPAAGTTLPRLLDIVREIRRTSRNSAAVCSAI